MYAISGNTIVDKVVHLAFRFLRYLLLFGLIAGVASFIRYRWMPLAERSHLWNFIVRMFDFSLSALSKTRLGFIYEGLIGVVAKASTIAYRGCRS